MAWIKTIPFADADESLRRILLEAPAACPPEYGEPVPAASPVNESIVASFDDTAILQITLIAAWFNYINRVADALGVGRG